MLDKPPSDSAERRKWYRERKREKQRNAVRKHRALKRVPEKPSKVEIKRQQTAERMRRFRLRKKQNTLQNTMTPTQFQNRMQKCRALKAAKSALTPYSPPRRAEIIKSIIDCQSPSSKSTRRCLEDQYIVKSKSAKLKEKVANAILTDFTASISAATAQTSPPENKRKAKQAVTFITGDCLQEGKLKCALSKETRLNRRLINKCLNRNKTIIDSLNMQTT